MGRGSHVGWLCVRACRLVGVFTRTSMEGRPPSAAGQGAESGASENVSHAHRLPPCKPNAQRVPSMAQPCELTFWPVALRVTQPSGRTSP